MQPNLRALVASLLAVSTVSVAALTGCAPAADESVEAVSAENSEQALSSAGFECVVDTITLKKGFLEDLSAAVAASAVKDYGPMFYKHVEIAKTLDAALPTTDEFGEWVYTFHGFDLHPEELPSGSTARPRFVATLASGSGALVDPTLVFSKRRYAAAKALFDALTRAQESTENHIVPPQLVYDRSWTTVTRTSPAGRIVCAKTTFPGTPLPDYSCSFFDVERTTVQSFNGHDAKCPVK